MDAESDALFLDLARAVVARDRVLREQLTALNPNDRRWKPLFDELVLVNRDRQLLREEVRRWKGADA
jgi:hypothetical protein